MVQCHLTNQLLMDGKYISRRLIGINEPNQNHDFWFLIVLLIL